MQFTVNGTRVFATTGGRELRPDLPLLVFVHGAALDRTTWQLQTRFFSHHGYSVLALDLPQHGGSEGKAPDSIEGYADWVADLIAATGYESAHVIGHSMGALIALETAARHPQAVKTLVLSGATSAMPVHPDLLAAAESGDHLAYELMTSWGHGRISHLGGHQTPGLWMVGSTMRPLGTGPGWGTGQRSPRLQQLRARRRSGQPGHVSDPAGHWLHRRDGATQIGPAAERRHHRCRRSCHRRRRPHHDDRGPGPIHRRHRRVPGPPGQLQRLILTVLLDSEEYLGVSGRHQPSKEPCQQPGVRL